MKTYEVWIAEKNYSGYRVEAENEEEAREKAMNAYCDWEEPFGVGATDYYIDTCEEVSEE